MRLSVAAVLGLATPAALAASGTGQSTRYWDCCKPSCSWPGKAAVDAPVGSCDAGNHLLANANAASGCGGGGAAFACAKNSPFAVTDALAYGFAATSIAGGSESSWCCACYALSFTSGPLASHNKTMIVQSTNTGGDLGSNQFDLMIPGGGVGAFAGGCAAQYGASLPGAQYGGVSSRAQCASMPAALRAGCYWRFDWFMAADNPSFRFKQVRCPDQLVGITGCRRHDDGQFPVWV